MPDALYWQVIEEMDEALGDLAAVTQTVREVYKEATSRLRDGERMSTMIADRGITDRRQLEDAIRVTQTRIRRARAHLIRTMVVEEGMTLTQTAKLMGVSRQAVSALYQEAINEFRLTSGD